MRRTRERNKVRWAPKRIWVWVPIGRPGCGGGSRRPLAYPSTGNHEVFPDVSEEPGALSGGGEGCVCGAAAAL